MRVCCFVITLLAGLILCEGRGYSQVTIKGNIFDQNTNETISNAHVFVESAGEAVISDSEGSFEIHVPGLPVLLSISHLSYHAKAILVDHVPTIDLNIKLVSKNFQVNEVVVVAERVQQFFRKEFFYVREMEFGDGFMWVIGYPDKNILKPELRIMSLGGVSLAKLNLNESGKLFKDAFGEIHLNFKDSLNQLLWTGDSIQLKSTFIKDGTEEYVFSLVASFDSLALLKRKVGTEVYNEYFAYNFLDSSQQVFHYSFDHELFASSNAAKKHQYGSIPDVIFLPFGWKGGKNARIKQSFDPTDAFTRHSQDRLLTFTPINSKLFKFDEEILIFEDKGPFLWKYSLDLQLIEMLALHVPDRSTKIDLLQDPVSSQLFLLFEQKGLEFISKVDIKTGELIKTMRLDGFTFVDNIRVYGNRVYYLDQSRAGAKTMNLYSMAID